MAELARRAYSGRSRQRSSSMAVLGCASAAACSSSSFSTRDPGQIEAAERARDHRRSAPPSG